MNERMWRGAITEKGSTKYLDRNLSQGHFIHHKSDMDRFRIEPVPYMMWPWDSFFFQKATSGFPSQHHSINAPYSYLIYLPPNDDKASPKSWVDNPQPARSSSYVARGHICKLCTHTIKNYTII